MTNISPTSTTQIDRLEPMCLDGNDLTYSATGYILPCCYADNHHIEDFKNLMTDTLLVDNVNDIHREIINSNEWKEFFKVLLESPQSAPRSCKYYCGSNWSTKNIK